MQPSDDDVGAPSAVVIRDAVRTIGGCDVDLDDHEIRLVFESKALDVLVLDFDFIVGVEITGEGRETQWWEERVLDGSKQRTGCLRQSRKDQFDLHCSSPAVSCRFPELRSRACIVPPPRQASVCRRAKSSRIDERVVRCA